MVIHVMKDGRVKDDVSSHIVSKELKEVYAVIDKVSHKEEEK